MIIINSNTRNFSIPGSDLVFGVVADSDAERKHFQCPRYVGDGLDLAACFIRINYRNANGKTDFYLVDDMVIDGDNITFSWLLSPKVTEYRGQVKFVMCAVGPDLKLKWHTTQGTGQVMEGLEPDNSHVESQTADVVAQLIAMVESQTNAVENTGAAQIEAVKDAAKTAQDDAVAEIEAKRSNSLNSIPADYTALSATVDAITREAAPGIVCHADGEVITLNDASDNYLRGLRIFGRSTQDGTPTPENPVEIVSVGDGGKIKLSLAGKNLWDHANDIVDMSSMSDWGTDIWGNVAVVKTLNPKTTYTMSCKVTCLSVPNYASIYSDQCGFVLYTSQGSDKNTLMAIDIGKGALVAGQQRILKGTFTTPENISDVSKNYRILYYTQRFLQEDGKAVYARIRVDDVQLEIGDTATAYESYRGQTIFTISNPNGVPGIPVTSGGNYTDANGQQWICDEVDFERGVYVQRVQEVSNFAPITTSNTNSVYQQTCTYEMLGQETPLSAICTHTDTYHYVAIDTTHFYIDGKVVRVYLPKGTDVTGLKVFAILKTPIEETLSETELAAYRALHTNKPNTTILNDSGAYMSVDYTADTKLYIDNKIKEALL